MSVMDKETLISEIETYASARGIAPATVASRAVGNSRLYHRLKDGYDCTTGVAERLRAYMKSNPPQQTEAAE